MKKLISVCLWLSILLSVLSNIAPRVNVVLSGSDFVTEITGVPFRAQAVDVDSEGRIFVVTLENAIWRSVDGALTWTKVYDNGYTLQKASLFTMMVASTDYVFAEVALGNTSKVIIRSIDHGNAWSIVLNMGTQVQSWHMDESLINNYLYIQTYQTGAKNTAIIYRSEDFGASFQVWYDISEPSPAIAHGHAVAVAPNGSIYFSRGDGQYGTLRRYNGSAWEELGKYSDFGDARTQPTAIWFDDTYVYLGPDGYDYVLSFPYAAPHTEAFSRANIVFSPAAFTQNTSRGNNIFEARRIGEIFLVGTYQGQLWGTWDNRAWVKLYETSGNTIGEIMSISRRSPIYFVDRGVDTAIVGKLFKVNVQKEDLIRLANASSDIQVIAAGVCLCVIILVIMFAIILHQSRKSRRKSRQQTDKPEYYLIDSKQWDERFARLGLIPQCRILLLV